MEPYLCIYLFIYSSPLPPLVPDGMLGGSLRWTIQPENIVPKFLSRSYKGLCELPISVSPASSPATSPYSPHIQQPEWSIVFSPISLRLFIHCPLCLKCPFLADPTPCLSWRFSITSSMKPSLITPADLDTLLSAHLPLKCAWFLL